MNRFVLYNPHGFWYKPSMKFLSDSFKVSSMNKYEYLFDYFYNNGRVYAYMDDLDKNVYEKHKKSFRNMVLSNGLNPFKISRIKTLDDLNKNDVLFMFLYGHFTTHYKLEKEPHELIEKLMKCKAYKVVHLTHYGSSAQYCSAYTKLAGIDLFVYENNLTKNSKFFRNYYKWYTNDVYALPFVPKERYVRKNIFSERKNLALITGSIPHPISDLIEFFGTDILHPMRKIIYDNRDYISCCAKCNILLLEKTLENENRKQEIKNIRKKKTLLQKIIRFFHKNILSISNFFYFISTILRIYVVKLLKINKSFFPVGVNIQYDIVAEMNNYKISITTEEIIGAPAISFAEAMKCGAAYMGLDDPMYTDLGMRPGVHYIGYDGSLEDMKNKIEYYLKNDQELERIAEEGYRFALREFSSDKVMKDFLRYCDMKMDEKNQEMSKI
ncbi:hypothetical protein FACS1894205_1770 [Alphaproteobacteria bacterium]|nr:hypothetical protein FACS1894205_1770 [Alphaproteobacteria bacterium]